MRDTEFRCFLDLMMCSDPWPIPNKKSRMILEDYADKVSTQFGYNDWIEAYHEFEVKKPESLEQILDKPEMSVV